MPIKVQCACGKAFAAKDELAGKMVKCPGCQKPLKIPGGEPAPAKAPARAKVPSGAKPPGKSAAAPAPKTAPAADAGSLFEEVGLQAAAAGTRPCPGCMEPLPEDAVICIKCGYNTKIGRRMQTMKVGGEPGAGGHSAVADDLLNKAAQVMDEDAAEEKKKTTEGMPWWVYLVILILLVCLAAYMLLGRGSKEPSEEEGKKGAMIPGIMRPVV
jgi:hypothetical protein